MHRHTHRHTSNENSISAIHSFPLVGIIKTVQFDIINNCITTLGSILSRHRGIPWHFPDSSQHSSHVAVTHVMHTKSTITKYTSNNSLMTLHNASQNAPSKLWCCYYATKHWCCPKCEVNERVYSQRKTHAGYQKGLRPSMLVPILTTHSSELHSNI